MKKEKDNVIIIIVTIIIEYALMCLYKKDYEYASGPEYPKF